MREMWVGVMSSGESDQRTQHVGLVTQQVGENSAKHDRVLIDWLMNWLWTVVNVIDPNEGEVQVSVIRDWAMSSNRTTIGKATIKLQCEFNGKL